MSDYVIGMIAGLVLAVVFWSLLRVALTVQSIARLWPLANPRLFTGKRRL
jgi:hypothetical protein